MSKYVLKSGEEIILSQTRVSDRTKNNAGMATGKLILTSEALVYERKGAFGKDLGFDAYPLNEIQVIDGEPQVKIGIRLGLKNLEVHLSDGKVLHFGLGTDNSSKSIRKWVNAIVKAITGTEPSVSGTESSFDISSLVSYPLIAGGGIVLAAVVAGILIAKHKSAKNDSIE